MEVVVAEIIMKNQGPADENDEEEGKEKTKRLSCF